MSCLFVDVRPLSVPRPSPTEDLRGGGIPLGRPPERGRHLEDFRLRSENLAKGEMPVFAQRVLHAHASGLHDNPLILRCKGNSWALQKWQTLVEKRTGAEGTWSRAPVKRSLPSLPWVPCSTLAANSVKCMGWNGKRAYPGRAEPGRIRRVGVWQLSARFARPLPEFASGSPPIDLRCSSLARPDAAARVFPPPKHFFCLSKSNL